jgi:hypothetical protein
MQDTRSPQQRAEFPRLLECYSMPTGKYWPKFEGLKNSVNQLSTLFYPEYEGTTILQNVETYLPVRTA